MDVQTELQQMILQNEANIFRCVDITGLPLKENRGYHSAILLGFALSPEYIHRLSTSSVADQSEFIEMERRADALGEEVACWLNNRGFLSYAQSEKNLGMHHEFNEEKKCSPLPHKTIAVMAGLGWIGKDDLLVTKEYGSALCFCTVLTNAPFRTENKEWVEGNCGTCNRCKEVCPAGVIKGAKWEYRYGRDRLIDVDHCECCLKCMVNCPWTLSYASRKVIQFTGRLSK